MPPPAGTPQPPTTPHASAPAAQPGYVHLAAPGGDASDVAQRLPPRCGLVLRAVGAAADVEWHALHGRLTKLEQKLFPWATLLPPPYALRYTHSPGRRAATAAAAECSSSAAARGGEGGGEGEGEGRDEQVWRGGRLEWSSGWALWRDDGSECDSCGTPPPRARHATRRPPPLPSRHDATPTATATATPCDGGGVNAAQH
eukprot:4946198-Prymnesium_polylepis.1